MPTQLLHARRSPPPPPSPSGAGASAHAGASGAQPIPPMMPMPPPPHYHHYKYFPQGLGPPPKGLKRGHAAADAAAIEATAEAVEAAAYNASNSHRWHWEHPRRYEAAGIAAAAADCDHRAARTGPGGRPGAGAGSFHRQQHQQQQQRHPRMISSGGISRPHPADEEGRQGAAYVYCGPSASQEEMLESALLLASLAGHSRHGQAGQKKRREDADAEENLTEEEEQELPATPTASNVSRPLRGDTGGAAELLPAAADGPFAANAHAHAHRPPSHVLPPVEAEAEAELESIPKPNIVTPVSSETGRFVEELHHHQRVEFPPPGPRSFYQLPERGAGHHQHRPKQHSMPRPSIFPSSPLPPPPPPPPEKKRERETGGGEEGFAPDSPKKARSVHHRRRQAFPPPPPGYFVGPMPPIGYGYPPAADYPFPYHYPYPQGHLTPRFDSERGNRDEYSPSPSPSPSPPSSKSPSPPYPPHSHPFPFPYFPSSPPSDGPSRRYHQMVPMPPHPAPNPLMFQHTDRGRAEATCKPELRYYPAIASLDPAEAHRATKAVITRSQKWAWRDFPELEAFLVANRDDYLRHSARNYTPEQKEYNNRLTQQLLAVAAESGYVFHSGDFDFGSVRDRIRCYYKSYVQANKKKGRIVSYPKTKRAKVADEE